MMANRDHSCSSAPEAGANMRHHKTRREHKKHKQLPETESGSMPRDAASRHSCFKTPPRHCRQAATIPFDLAKQLGYTQAASQFHADTQIWQHMDFPFHVGSDVYVVMQAGIDLAQFQQPEFCDMCHKRRTKTTVVECSWCLAGNCLKCLERDDVPGGFWICHRCEQGKAPAKAEHNARRYFLHGGEGLQVAKIQGFTQQPDGQTLVTLQWYEPRWQVEINRKDKFDGRQVYLNEKPDPSPQNALAIFKPVDVLSSAAIDSCSGDSKRDVYLCKSMIAEDGRVVPLPGEAMEGDTDIDEASDDDDTQDGDVYEPSGKALLEPTSQTRLQHLPRQPRFGTKRHGADDKRHSKRRAVQTTWDSQAALYTPKAASDTIQLDAEALQATDRQLSELTVDAAADIVGLHSADGPSSPGEDEPCPEQEVIGNNGADSEHFKKSAVCASQSLNVQVGLLQPQLTADDMQPSTQACAITDLSARRHSSVSMINEDSDESDSDDGSPSQPAGSMEETQAEQDVNDWQGWGNSAVRDQTPAVCKAEKAASSQGLPGSLPACTNEEFHRAWLAVRAKMQASTCQAASAQKPVLAGGHGVSASERAVCNHASADDHLTRQDAHAVRSDDNQQAGSERSRCLRPLPVCGAQHADDGPHLVAPLPATALHSLPEPVLLSAGTQNRQAEEHKLPASETVHVAFEELQENDSDGEEDTLQAVLQLHGDTANTADFGQTSAESESESDIEPDEMEEDTEETSSIGEQEADLLQQLKDMTYADGADDMASADTLDMDVDSCCLDTQQEQLRAHCDSISHDDNIHQERLQHFLAKQDPGTSGDAADYSGIQPGKARYKGAETVLESKAPSRKKPGELALAALQKKMKDICLQPSQDLGPEKSHRELLLEAAQERMAPAAPSSSIVCRTEQREAMTKFIRCCVHMPGLGMKFMELIGPAGTGKVATALHVVGALQAQVKAGTLKPFSFAHVEVKQRAAHFFDDLFQAMWEEHFTLPEGSDSRDIIERLLVSGSAASAKELPHIRLVLIDGIDLLLKDHPKAVSRLKEWLQQSSYPLAVIATASTATWRDGPHEAEAAALKYRTSQFPKYSSQDLVDILVARLEDVDVAQENELQHIVQQVTKLPIDYKERLSTCLRVCHQALAIAQAELRKDKDDGGPDQHATDSAAGLVQSKHVATVLSKQRPRSWPDALRNLAFREALLLSAMCKLLADPLLKTKAGHEPKVNLKDVIKVMGQACKGTGVATEMWAVCEALQVLLTAKLITVNKPKATNLSSKVSLVPPLDQVHLLLCTCAMSKTLKDAVLLKPQSTVSSDARSNHEPA